MQNVKVRLRNLKKKRYGHKYVGSFGMKSALKSMYKLTIKVIILKSRVEVSLVEQDIIELVS